MRWRTAAPVAVRRVTFGAAEVMTLAGRLRISETTATMIGVTAVAMIDPRCQKSGTTIAAATAARLEIRRVVSDSPLPLSFCFSGLTCLRG